MTMRGMILGTAAYMSPEQARGTAVDKRADIWAFGAVLYEMLSGVRPFGGEDATEVIAAVVKTTPGWSALPADLPRPIVTLIQRCLEKDRKARVGDIAVARFLLADSAALTVAPGSRIPARSSLRWMAALAVATLVIAAMATPTVRHLRETRPPLPPEMRLEITTRATDAPMQFALSPDGRSLVSVASGDGPSRLWLRGLDQTEAKPLAGTEGATRRGRRSNCRSSRCVTSASPWSLSANHLGPSPRRRLVPVPTARGDARDRPDPDVA